MTEIKIAQAWGPKIKKSGGVSVTPIMASQHGSLVPVVIVHGLTEAEVHEAAVLLEKSREVCEWEDGYLFTDCKRRMNGAVTEFCPSCGRKVVVK